MKYVAFLDVLGFKEKLKGLTQNCAKDYINLFASSVYEIFKNEPSNCVTGYIVSDSIILNTNSCGETELIKLINLTDLICKSEFTENGIMIRGAICKGEFESIPAKELSSLRKGLIVGQAYVDAYLMEGTVKSLGIVLSKEVWQDLINCGLDQNLVEEKMEEVDRYIYRYLNIEFLLTEKNLFRFVKNAVESSWLPHYYNTIYFAMKNEKNDSIVDIVFHNVLNILQKEYGWRMVDTFIKNSFVGTVVANYQMRFLRFLRKNIFSAKVVDDYNI